MWKIKDKSGKVLAVAATRRDAAKSIGYETYRAAKQKGLFAVNYYDSEVPCMAFTDRHKRAERNRDRKAIIDSAECLE